MLNNRGPSTDHCGKKQSTDSQVLNKYCTNIIDIS